MRNDRHAILAICALVCWTTSTAQTLSQSESLPGRYSEGLPPRGSPKIFPEVPIGEDGTVKLPVKTPPFALLDDPLLKTKLDRLIQVQRPSESLVIAQAIEVRPRPSASACLAKPILCEQSAALAKTAATIKAAVGRSPGCDPAAAKMAEHYSEGDASDTVARAFDLACLGAFQTRAGALLPTPPGPVPAAFGSGGALAAVGLLMIGGKPVCAGLLRSNHRFITARHCYNDLRDEIEAGRTMVQPASGSAPWAIKGVIKAPVDESATPVRTDWIALAIDPAASLSLPEVTLDATDLSGEVTLVAHFTDFDAVGYPDGASVPNWRKGLRFPVSGLCHVLERRAGCVALTCQTVKGFSGAPLFKVDRRKLSVVGFVSQPESSQSGCSSNIAGVTFATSAHLVDEM